MLFLKWGTEMQTEIGHTSTLAALEALSAASKIIDRGLLELTANPMLASSDKKIAGVSDIENAEPSFKLPPGCPSQNTLTALARKLIKQRRKRLNFFPDYAFGEPVWDVLLDLYVAGCDKRLISVSSVCIAAGVPPTTAFRHVTMMTIEGLIVRTQSPKDCRVIYVSLSDEIRNSMDNYLASLLLDIA
jgi:DNA-binding MarR family transcriptional regulator